MGRALVALLLMILSASADKTSLDCPLRQIGLDYAATLQPFRSAAAFQEIADALNGAIEAANCSVKPKALGSAASAASTRVAWAPLPAAESGVGRVFADPSKGSDTAGDGSEAKPFRTIQRALKAVSAARARLGRDHGAAGQTTAPFAVILRAGTFYLTDTVQITQSDITIQPYQAADADATAEEVIVSGGLSLKPTWTKVPSIATTSGSTDGANTATRQKAMKRAGRESSIASAIDTTRFTGTISVIIAAWNRRPRASVM